MAKKETVYISGVPFSLRRVPASAFNAGCLGISSLEESEIRMKESLTKEQFDSTLIHEWLHMVFDSNSFLSESGNEQLISCLQNNLYQAGFRVPINKKSS